MFKKEIYINRRNNLRNQMKSGLVLILGNPDSPMNYPANTFHFRQDSNFLYLFGLDYQNLAGVIDIDENKHYIFGNDVDLDDIIWMGPQESMKDKAEKVGIDNTSQFGKLNEFLISAIQKGRKVHFLPPYRAENSMLLGDLLGIRPSKVMNYVSSELIKAVVSLRSVKENVEIIEIEKACDIGYEMHTKAMKLAFAGRYEREVAGIVEGIPVSYGGMLSFPVILSQNGETLHNHDHSQILESGKLMLTDAGAETDTHYASDFTRTVPVGGKFSQRQKEIYQIVLNANNAAIAAIKPGVLYKDIHLLASKVIANGLIDLGIMKGNADEAVRQGVHAVVFPHGLGHMMGLDVHDMEDLKEDFVGYDEKTERSDQFGTAYLRLGRELKPNFVLTTEPGIYFIPALIQKWKNEKKFTEFINYNVLESYIGFGGIRLEDDIIVTETGCRFLGGKRIPITIAEIEATMAK